MKQINLSKLDYSLIQDYANRLWQERSSAKDDNFNVRCIVDALVNYTKSRGLTIKDGNVYEEEKTQKLT